MIVTHEVNLDRELTPQEIEMLEALKDRPIEFDEDCPPLTDEQLRQFRRVSDKKHYL